VPLNAIYPALYLDCVVFKYHKEKRVINKAVYLALAINRKAIKFLGLWIAENGGWRI